MDQRRLFLFLTICFLLMIVFGPKPKPVDKPEGDQAAVADNADVNADGAGNALVDQSTTDESSQPLEVDDDSVEAAPLETTEADLEFVTLGSVDPDSPYRLGVTLTNAGAAVRRVELSSKRFRDLHDRSGYLGHLELTPVEGGGVRVQSLVAGSPAASAGIEVGDVIMSLSSGGDEIPTDTAAELIEALDEFKPGRTLTLKTKRGDEAAAGREVELTRRPLEVIRPEIENVGMRVDDVTQLVRSPPSFLFTFEKIGQERLASSEEIQRQAQKALDAGLSPAQPRQELAGVSLRDSNWEITERDETSVTFRTRLPKRGLEVEKRYRLKPVPNEDQSNKNYPAYDLTLELVVRNLSDEELPIRYRLDGPNGLPIEGWWYANKVGRTWSAVGIRDVIARHVGNETVQFGPTEISRDGVETMQGPPLAFAGVDAQYFSAILLPNKPNVDESWIDELRSVSLSPKPKPRSNEGRYANVTCRLISHPQTIAAGETLQHSYTIFTGPKRPELLDQYQASDSPRYGLGDLMYYGWFGVVAKLMLYILHFFYGILGNYGIAIIMLTVLVRGCMFPVSRKQAQSMAKMQELRPEMDKIKEKYKQDMQKQSQATQELYRKHNINPLAGCLPLFIQMPIFLGLYRSLMVDVELRQAPLLGEGIRWCSNLAAPDMFYDWSWFMPDFVTNGETFIVGLGPYLNILPLATAGLFLLQQKMFMPEPANEQAAMQQQIMKYMMLVMGLLFFKVAAGLCIYFIASSTWGIAERKMLPKPTPSDALSTPVSTSSTKTSSKGYSSDSAPRKRNKKAKKKKR